jgi:hypothetical protein
MVVSDEDYLKENPSGLFLAARRLGDNSHGGRRSGCCDDMFRWPCGETVSDLAAGQTSYFR